MKHKVTGRIRERRNSTEVFYQVILYFGKDERNKRKEAYLRAETREEAEALLERSLAECTLQTFLPPEQRTLESYIMDEYLPIYSKQNVKSTSYRAYKQSASYICKCLGHVRMCALTTTMVQQFLMELLRCSPFSKNALAYATVKGIQRDLNVFMKKAEELHYIRQNPVTGTKIARPKKNLDEDEKQMVLSKGQVRQLLEFVAGMPEECHYSLMIDGSLRRGEVLGLSWSDVDWDNGSIKIRNNWVEGDEGVELTTPKSRTSVRVIKLTEHTMTLLKREYLRYKKTRMLNRDFHDSNRVVFKKNGEPPLPKSFYRNYKRILERAGLPAVSMHALRHTSITLQLEAGASLKSVSMRAGHADTQITSNIYSHSTHAMEEQTVEILEDVLSGVG